MPILAHKWVVNGSMQGKAAFARANVCVMMHGIMGSGRNWMSPARAVVNAHPNWKVLLIDHRGHGQSGRLPQPHNIQACAQDIQDTIESATPERSPSIVMGHSFGGKVALAYAQLAEVKKTWLFDSFPGTSDLSIDNNVVQVLSILKKVSSSGFNSRNEATNLLVESGLDFGTAAWLASSVMKNADGSFDFSHDLDTIEKLYEDYCSQDYWDVAENLASEGKCGLVCAGKSWVWDGKDCQKNLEHFASVNMLWNMKKAGHNLHVDDLPGLMRIVLKENANDWAH